MRFRWLVLLTAVSGCVKAPPATAPDLPVDPPEAWITGEEISAEVDPEWWKSFGDETLNALVAEALENNYDLAVAAARVEQAAADARVAAADLYPQVSAALNGSRRKQNFIGFPIPGGEGLC